jgi:hypothetical protein
MRYLFLRRIIPVACVAFFLFACESHEKHSDEAYERVKAQKSLPEQDEVVAEKSVHQIKKHREIKKAEPVDEWYGFKVEIEKRILANEKLIKQLKNTPNPSAKLTRKLERIEKENSAIITQLVDYQNNVKAMLMDFKLKTGEEVSRIDTELKELGTK